MIGLDWLGLAGTLTGLWMLGNRDRRAFAVSLCANACWIAYALTVPAGPAIALALTNILIAVLNVRGYLSWGSAAKRERDDEEFAARLWARALVLREQSLKAEKVPDADAPQP